MAQLKKISCKNSKVKKFRFTQDKVFDLVVAVILVLIIVIMAYPIYFVFVASFSDPAYVNNGSILLWPRGFTLLGYQKVFEDTRIWIGYGNTLIYTIGGTALGTLVTMMAGYALSRKDLPFRNAMMGYFVFTMYFGGGLIPFYMVVKKLSLTNTKTLMVIISAVAVYNIIITRSFMESNIPEELRDAARVDGCGNGRFFFKIVLPLSKAIVSVIGLWAAVGLWNSYFNAMIYLQEEELQPLQLVLRNILINNQAMSTVETGQEAAEMKKIADPIKYGVIVISSLPIMMLYPFVQKYFNQGVMLGSVKG